MKRLKQRTFSFIWFIFILFFISSMITVSFFVTGYLYKTFGWHLPALVAQIINTLLGLLLTSLLIGIITSTARSRGWFPEMRGFAPVIDALEKIARGDFSVRLESPLRDNQMVGELANSINKMAVELNQMENLRQEFISNVSHEIQSPLTSIRGFAQALENDQLTPEERHHYLNIIEEESIRLSRITEDLLKLASLESDGVQFDPKLYRLDKQIRSLILVCEPQWTEKQINMDVSIEEIEIAADEDLLSQVWMNLITNSIKFTPEGGKLLIGLSCRNDKIEFKITDTGIGIPEEDQSRIFERFYKADKSRTRLYGGSGLGLSIVKKIIDLHKGTINLESKVGEGTTFIISLPLEHL